MAILNTVEEQFKAYQDKIEVLEAMIEAYRNAVLSSWQTHHLAWTAVLCLGFGFALGKIV